VLWGRCPLWNSERIPRGKLDILTIFVCFIDSRLEEDNYSESMTEEKVTHREYIRNTADTHLDWKYIRSTAEINKLYEITLFSR